MTCNGYSRTMMPVLYKNLNLTPMRLCRNDGASNLGNEGYDMFNPHSFMVMEVLLYTSENLNIPTSS
jgi:hypothetical protein